MKELIMDYVPWILPLAILITVLYFRIKLVLYFAGAFYGKYSIKYIDLSRKYYGDTPFAHGINVELMEHITHFKMQRKNAALKRRDKDLMFSEIKHGSSIKGLIEKRGKPVYCNGKKEGNNKVIYIGYDKLIEGINIKELYYFINDSYFLGEYIFEYYNNKLPSGFFKSFYGLTGFDKKEINGHKLFANINQQQYAQIYEDNGFSVSVKYFKEETANKVRL